MIVFFNATDLGYNSLIKIGGLFNLAIVIVKILVLVVVRSGRLPIIFIS